MKIDVLCCGDLVYFDRFCCFEDFMFCVFFVLFVLFCVVFLFLLVELLCFVGDDGCFYLCFGMLQWFGYLVEVFSQVFWELLYFDSLFWLCVVQMVCDGYCDGLVGVYGFDGLWVGSEFIGWVGLVFYICYDSDWYYFGDVFLFGQCLGFVQGYVNNLCFEVWCSQVGDDDLYLQVFGGECVLLCNLQKLLFGCIDVLLEDCDIIEYYLEYYLQFVGQICCVGELFGWQLLYVGFSLYLLEVDVCFVEFDEGLC